MDKKCTCGAAKTYGEDTNLHVDYCDLIRTDTPAEDDTSSYPTSDDTDKNWPWVTWDRWTMLSYDSIKHKLIIKPIDIKNIIK